MFTVITGNEIVADIHIHGTFDRPNMALESQCVLGGSHLFNTFAIAAGIRDEELEGRVLVLGTLSTDQFGKSFRAIAKTLGVDTSHAVDTNASTLVAFVQHGEHNNTFDFPNKQDNALNATRLSHLPIIESAHKIMVVQGVCSTVKPSGDVWYEYAKNDENLMIVYDANIRMPFIDSIEVHQDLLTRWAGRADVMKTSDADIQAIYGRDASIDAVAHHYLQSGASIVCVTQGKDPVLTYSHAGRIDTPVPPLSVKNTVGAGDNFLGGITVGFAKAGLFDAPALRAATAETLQTIAQAGIQRSAKHLTLINS